MKIGNILFNNNIALAPMAGVSDLSFRLICREFGAGILYSEMVSAKAICYKDKRTLELLKTDPREQPLIVQIFGSDVQSMANAAKSLEQMGVRAIDINMGCPTPKIVGNGDGSALLKDPKLAGQIMHSVSSGVSIPVTVKIRIGWDDITAVDVAKVLCDSGAAAIAVHGRTREQFYSGVADWDAIAKVKQAVTVPVIANGDVFCGYDAKRILEVTGCDGVMVGRGALGNPWIFSEILEVFASSEFLEISTSGLSDTDSSGEEFSSGQSQSSCQKVSSEKATKKPTAQQKMNVALRHIELLVENKGEYIAIREARKHVSWYLKSIIGGSKLKQLANQAKNFDEMCNVLLMMVNEDNN